MHEGNFTFNQAMILVLFYICHLPLGSADKTISINLVPRDYVDPREVDGFICGLDKEIDKDRLLAEHNPSFILEFLDNRNDENPSYKTSVFNVLGFCSNDQPIKMLEMYMNKDEEPALYSLLMVPPQAQCNTMTFEEARDNNEDYFPIFVGNAMELTAALDAFITQAPSLKNIYQGRLPKLCGTKQSMEEKVIKARATMLNLLFSFPLHQGSQRSIDGSRWKVCKTQEDTMTSLYNSNFFDMSPQVHFENEMADGHEGDGFAVISLSKTSDKSRRSVILVRTEPGNATENDFVGYNGPVVFDINQNKLDILVQVKIDDLDEEKEHFKIGYEFLSRQNRRKKRADPFVEETSVGIENQPLQSAHLKAINNCRWRVIKALTKEMAYWETEEKKQTSLSLVNSEVVGLFQSLDPKGTNKITMYRRAGIGYLEACNKIRKLVPSKSGNELWFSTSLKHSRMFHNEGSEDNTNDILFEIAVNLQWFLHIFNLKIVNNENAGTIWNNHKKGKGQTKEPYPESHWKNLIHRENLNRDRPNPVGKQKKQVDHPWGKINFATVGKIQLQNFQDCIEEIRICKMERLTDGMGKLLNEYKVKGCKPWEEWEKPQKVDSNIDSDTDTLRSSQSKMDMIDDDNQEGSEDDEKQNTLEIKEREIE